MNKVRWVVMLVVVGLAGGGHQAAGQEKPKLPEGWMEFQPEEKDFSVAVPGKADVASPIKETNQTIRGYSFPKGDARLTVMLFVDRKGEARKQPQPETLRFDTDIVKGTLKAVKLDAMPGLEYQRKEADGTVAHYRVYRAADGSRALTLMILKADKLTPQERTAFLNSFKFVKAKK
jgi:hypothetical protein